MDCLLDLTYKAASDILADAEVRRAVQGGEALATGRTLAALWLVWTCLPQRHGRRLPAHQIAMEGCLAKALAGPQALSAAWQSSVRQRAAAAPAASRPQMAPHHCWFCNAQRLLPCPLPLQAINLAAGGNGSALTPQDIALAAAQHARLQPQPPSMQVGGHTASGARAGDASCVLTARAGQGVAAWAARAGVRVWSD